jgi:hypothetical protein
VADPGFDPHGVLVAPILLDSPAYNSGERTRTYYERSSSGSRRSICRRRSART